MANLFAQNFVPSAPGMEMFGQELADMEQKQQEQKLFKEFQKALGAKAPPTASVAPVMPESKPVDYSLTSGMAPTSSLGVKPDQALGAPPISFAQPSSLLDAVRLHLGD